MDNLTVDDIEIDLGKLAQKASAAPAFIAGRELTEEDFASLSTDTKGVKPAALKSIRAIHHMVARMLATGMKDIDVAEHTGMSNTRISILKKDVAFKALITHYTKREDERFIDVQERAVALGLTAGEILHERMESDPDSVSNNSLLEIMKASLDRGGHSPINRSQNVSVHIGANELAAIKENANAKEKGQIFSPSERTIEGTVIEEAVSTNNETPKGK